MGKKVRECDTVKKMTKQEANKIMTFCSFVMKEEVKVRGKAALDLELPFDEATMLREQLDLVKKQLGVKDVIIQDASSSHPKDTNTKRDVTAPGKPQIVFWKE